MTVLSVKQVRGLGDELQRDPLQHANHAVSLLNCVKADVTEVRSSGGWQQPTAVIDSSSSSSNQVALPAESKLLPM